MSQTIAVLGATGVFARHLIPRLIAAGHRVRAIVRRIEAAGVARACGAEIHVADIFDDAALRAALQGCDIGVNLATSLPGPSGRGSYEANDRLRRDGTAIWIDAATRAGVPRILQQSIAMVNAAGDDRWCDENTAFAGSDNEITASAIEASLAMEATVKSSPLDWLILRGALFYGPGTGFDDDWFARAKAGNLRMPGDGTAYVSLVHITDMANATVAAIQKWPSRETIVVADDEPAQWRNLFGYIAEVAGGAPPHSGGRLGFTSFRVRNTKARELLGWKPFYASYRMGLVR
jgi:nucleoside-diphosphate-sugar epimerase